MAQIAFITLFLGLTLGSQPIELTVTGPVAAVELRLDGAPAGLIAGPPWSGRIDFGHSLMPHELVARALDAQGNEIGRVQQWVNLPRPPAEVDIFLENGSAGRPVAARITWQSLTGESPSAVEVTFDDKPLAMDERGRVQLPAGDPEASHVLSAVLRFSDALIARRDVVFGGRWGEEVSTELTAVPVRLRRGKELPPPEQMGGWFRAGGRPVAVAALEEGPAELLVVRDAAAQNPLDTLLGGGSRARPSLGMRPSIDQSSQELRRHSMTLDKEDVVRFVVPAARTVPGSSLPADLFGQSRELNTGEGGLLWLLARFSPPLLELQQQRLADAAAVAGLQTLYRNRRRAVLVVLSERPAEASRAAPSIVRRYLDAIRVPLYVWALGDPRAAAAIGWGKAERVDSVGRIKSAFNRLKDDLASQRIVLVDGRHLPQSIELSPEAAAFVELVR